ncbi:MAG: CPBP family intramembrane metalloprotease [Polyangiaceae bacterium]|nr:CPBP family intramembrane metalloprotease [Polyangiaceae bacterium]
MTTTTIAGGQDSAETRRLWRRAAGYSSCLFVLTHALAGAYLVSGGSWRRPDSLLAANLIMLLPGLLAIAMVRWVFHEPVRRTLGLSFSLNRWSALAFVLPLLLSGATLLVGLALPGTTFSPELAGLSERFNLQPSQLEQMVPRLGHLPLAWTVVAQGIVLGPTLCTLTGLAEELGWRGLLFHHLTSLGFWRRSWAIGLIWGAWHVPLVFEGYGYPNHPLLGALLLVAFTLLASPLYVFLRARSGSVLTAGICHGAFGGSILLSFAPIAGGSELTTGLIALPGLLVMAVVNVVLFFAVRANGSPRAD